MTTAEHNADSAKLPERLLEIAALTGTSAPAAAADEIERLTVTLRECRELLDTQGRIHRDVEAESQAEIERLRSALKKLSDDAEVVASSDIRSFVSEVLDG